MLKNGFLALLCVTLLTACLTNREPHWVSNPKLAYPEEQFLVAIGAGDTRQAAEYAATASLSRIFESHIESDERLLDQSRETTSSFERTTDFSSDINILSSQTLFNIQHAEAWKDQLGRYHAVAYLNRRDTAEIYRDKIGTRTARVNYLLAHIQTEDDLLKKYATYRAAIQHANIADSMLRQLKVIYPSSVPGATPSYSLNKLRKSLADTARQIEVTISVKGDPENRMAEILQELITQYGFMVGQPATLNLFADVDLSDTGERSQGLVCMRYELMLQVKDTKGHVVITVRDKGREAHKTLDQARTRSFRTLENAIMISGVQRLDAYFAALVDQ